MYVFVFSEHLELDKEGYRQGDAIGLSFIQN